MSGASGKKAVELFVKDVIGDMKFGLDQATTQFKFTRSSAVPFGSDMSVIDLIQKQLDFLHGSGSLLCNRFKLGDRTDRTVGGQGVVQFASLATNPKRQFAINFFLDRDSFDTEQAWFMDETLHTILPAVENIFDNITSPIIVLGRPLPPAVVIEKGESLDEYQRRAQPDYASSLQIMVHLVQRAAAIHKVGIVHRELKPANVILYPARNEWTVIDFGSAGKRGTLAPFACSLAYAAPETVQAFVSQEMEVVADPAVDVWGLGVMAWELFTHTRLFPPGTHRDDIIDALLEVGTLPWERVGEPEYDANMRKLGFVREAVCCMLERNPANRITLQELMAEWRSLMRLDDA